jgi:hypothetical protein
MIEHVAVIYPSEVMREVTRLEFYVIYESVRFHSYGRRRYLNDNAEPISHLARYPQSVI